LPTIAILSFHRATLSSYRGILVETFWPRFEILPVHACHVLLRVLLRLHAYIAPFVVTYLWYGRA
jgi:hypothetical protein